MPYFASDKTIEAAIASENPLSFLLKLLLEKLKEKSPDRYEKESTALAVHFTVGAAACFDLMMWAIKAESDQASMKTLSRIAYQLEVFSSMAQSLEAVSKARKSSQQHPN